MSEDNAEGGAEAEGPTRNDAGKKKPGRKPKAQAEAAARHDSPDDWVPINGFGLPFEIDLVPGWKAFWSSDRDLDRMSFRPWVAATWDDPRVLGYKGGRRPENGGAIKYNELHCYLMRADHAVKMHAADPQRQVHRDRLEFQLREAQESQQGGHRGMANFTVR